MTVFDEIATHGIVPVIEIDDAEQALPLADALAEGGLPVAEITFRTAAAEAALAAIARERPGILVGAGTVLTAAQVDAALRAGARYALAPGLNREVVAHAAAQGLPFAPGIVTPSEIEAALAGGCRMVKFFPAMAAGGPEMLRTIAGPYAHTGLVYNPTGGVSLDNLAAWMALPQVAAVGGTWIAPRGDVAAGRWDRIAENARVAVARVSDLRGG